MSVWKELIFVLTYHVVGLVDKLQKQESTWYINSFTHLLKTMEICLFWVKHLGSGVDSSQVLSLESDPWLNFPTWPLFDLVEG